jgi:hypothetical protein
MINLSKLSSIIGDKKVIVVGGDEWNEIVKLVPNNEDGFNFLSGDDLNEYSIFDLLFDLSVEVKYTE